MVWLQVNGQTSVVFDAWPAAKQPKKYRKEFVRWAYVAVDCFTLGPYMCHPDTQQASYRQ